MAEYKVVEMFTSINGEGTKAGQLAVFVRLQGCNLNCSYCDTKWANEKDAPFRIMTEDEIVKAVLDTGVSNVTLTGGEPLLQKDVDILLERFGVEERLSVEVETNGSVSIGKYAGKSYRPSMTMDYKLPSSGMEDKMCLENYSYIEEKDTVKFVCGSREDLEKAYEVICRYDLTEKCHVYLSPVFGKIQPVDMVDFMKEKNLNGVNLQLQLHKFIWSVDERGV